MKLTFIPIVGGVGFELTDIKDGQTYTQRVEFLPEYFGKDDVRLRTARVIAETVQRSLEMIAIQQERDSPLYQQQHGGDSRPTKPEEQS